MNVKYVDAYKLDTRVGVTMEVQVGTGVGYAGVGNTNDRTRVLIYDRGLKLETEVSDMYQVCKCK